MFKGLLHAAYLAMQIGQKILEIHTRGATKKIGDKIHGVLSEVHDVIDKHHTDAGCKDEQDAR